LIDKSYQKAIGSVTSCRTAGDHNALIDKLDFLLSLARERHFGRAAESCGVTQPTLSAGIKQIEQQMGVRLVNRGSRFQSFTPEGEKVLEWARRIVGDTRAMRAEINALRHGLTGQLRIAAIPTALAMVASLTTPFRLRHPNVRFTIMSRTSIEVLEQLENLEIDAGVTYLDNEPLGRVTAVPLYRERYRLLTSSDAPLGDRASVTWAEVAQVPLCLLTPNMQNRRIIDGLLRSAGGSPQPTLESNSMIVLFAHVRTGRWASNYTYFPLTVDDSSNELFNSGSIWDVWSNYKSCSRNTKRYSSNIYVCGNSGCNTDLPIFCSV